MSNSNWKWATHYSSFADVAADFGCKPYSKQTKNKARLLKQQENFAKRHVCKACGKPLVFYNDTNVMVCTNPDCKGIAHEKTDKDGNNAIYYTPSYQILDEKGAEIATTILN